MKTFVLPIVGDSCDLIQRLRMRFDPLATKIPPHVTLVFPFEGRLSEDQVIGRVQSQLSLQKSISAQLKAPESCDTYSFFPIASEESQFHRLHSSLYSGLLSEYKNSSLIYKPHITFGRFKSLDESSIQMEQTKQVFHEAELSFNRVSLEIIHEDDTGEIIKSWLLS